MKWLGWLHKSRSPICVEIFSKSDCHLCDEMSDAFHGLQNEFPMTITYTDITSDEALFEKYRYDIPVVFVNGRKAFKHRTTTDAIRKRLRREI